MKFLTVRDFRSKSSQIWRELGDEHEMVLTLNGKPIAILSAVSEDTLEETLSAIRQARTMAAITAMQKRSVKTGTDQLTLEQINAEIAQVRKERDKRSAE